MILTGAFMGKDGKPEEARIAAILGPTAALWHDLQEQIASRFAPLEEEWTYAGKNYGWSLRLKRKNRAVLYMTPCDGSLTHRQSNHEGHEAHEE